MLVKDLMVDFDEMPKVATTDMFKLALDEMSNKGLGIVCVIDAFNILQGVITDGDLRRRLLKTQKPLSSLLVDDCIDLSVRDPHTVNVNAKWVEGLQLMEDKEVWDLPVVDDHGHAVGLLHLHSVVRQLMIERTN